MLQRGNASTGADGRFMHEQHVVLNPRQGKRALQMGNGSPVGGTVTMVQQPCGSQQKRGSTNGGDLRSSSHGPLQPVDHLLIKRRQDGLLLTQMPSWNQHPISGPHHRERLELGKAKPLGTGKLRVGCSEHEVIVRSMLNRRMKDLKGSSEIKDIDLWQENKENALRLFAFG